MEDAQDGISKRRRLVAASLFRVGSGKFCRLYFVITANDRYSGAATDVGVILEGARAVALALISDVRVMAMHGTPSTRSAGWMSVTTGIVLSTKL